MLGNFCDQRSNSGHLLHGSPSSTGSGSKLHLHNVMKPEERLLLACTQHGFQERHRQTVHRICCTHAVDWEVVGTTALDHGVLPLVYVNLQRCNAADLGIPPDRLAEFRQHLMDNIVLKQQSSERLEAALAFFHHKSIDVMVIKGAALDILVYDPPWYTTSHDVDLVLRVEREALSDSEQQALSDELHRSGIEFDYFTHHDVVMNGVLPVDFHRVWQDAHKVNVGEQEAFVMSPEDMLISLCINSCRKRFFRLKTLCDIATTIHRCPALDWTKLVQKAKAYDCQPIVYAALWITKVTVDCELPANVLNNLEVNHIRVQLIRWLSGHMSLCAYSSLVSNFRLWDRALDWSLLLPYITFRGYQVLRRMGYVYATR